VGPEARLKYVRSVLGEDAVDPVLAMKDVGLQTFLTSVITGFRRDVNDICAVLGYYAASNGNPLSTFRDNVSVPFSRVKKSKKKSKKTYFGLLDPGRWDRYVFPKHR
jgi:hypothetical protein